MAAEWKDEYVNLAKVFAGRFHRSYPHLDFDDFVQEACIGALSALDESDYKKPCRQGDALASLF
jgi:DNA-directed RNA polymerase specialized sigma subunit